MEKKMWNGRGFVSFLVFASFVFLGVTGIILFFTPQGRIAYWIEWTFLGLSKDDWTNIHVLFSLLFIVSGIFHTVLNWKPLTRYFIDKARGGLHLKREIAATILIVLALFFSALFVLPPLGYVLVLEEHLKALWVTEEDYEPPFGHAELLSLKSFCNRMSIDTAAAAAELQKAGIAFAGPEETLKAIAAKNGTSPMRLYRIIKVHGEPVLPDERGSFTPEEIDRKFIGRGFGKKTLDEACRELRLDCEEARRKLASRGIAAGGGDVLKDAADRHGLEMTDLLKVILIEDYEIPKRP